MNSTLRSQGSGHSTAYLFNSSTQRNKRFSITRNTLVIDRNDIDNLLVLGSGENNLVHNMTHNTVREFSANNQGMRNS